MADSLRVHVGSESTINFYDKKITNKHLPKVLIKGNASHQVNNTGKSYQITTVEIGTKVW